MIKDLESGNLSCTIGEKFLSDLKEKFSKRNNEIIKVAELKKVE